MNKKVTPKWSIEKTIQTAKEVGAVLCPFFAFSVPFVFAESGPVLAKRFKDLIPGSSTGGSNTNAKDNSGQGAEEGGK